MHRLVPASIARNRSSADEGADVVVGRDEIEGLADGLDSNDDVKGSQTGSALALLDPSVFVLKYTPVEAKMKHPFGKLPMLTVLS